MTDPVYLLDANVCIYLLEGKFPRAAERISDCAAGSVVTSSIVYAEVMIGARRLGKAEHAEAFFAEIPPLPFDNQAGERYSHLPFRRGSYDRLIAAQAVAMGLVLITNNTADFSDVPGLVMENWTK
ncbi:MAG: hypothetical protein RIS17_912 [Pseudomonadota bacterium]|jgi:tRNA(fMet)-specific endonuclease VapC